jgi:hypothetical protein
MICSHNRHIQPSHKYKPGDKVYLEATNITVACPTKKLTEKWLHPIIYGAVHSIKAIQAPPSTDSLPNKNPHL